MEITLAQPADFADVLELQARYHLSATAADDLAEGFVSTTLTLETLQQMHDERAIWVAREGEVLAAYACAIEWDFYAGSGFVERVFGHLPLPFGDDETRLVSAENSFLYGPTCIHADFRGRGLLPQLTAAIAARYRSKRAFGVCFVDVRNARSLAAHERKLGFRRLTLMPTSSPDVIYHMLAFETA